MARVDVPPVLARRLTAAIEHETRAATQLADARLLTSRRFAQLADQGYSVRALAEASGLSVGLVHQLIREGRG
jgi:hypothetical protein